MKPELLAPCHDMPTLIAAVKAGADAVYFGLRKHNMRLKAGNFSTNQLNKVVDYCHNNKVKAYLTINSIIYEDELREVEKLVIKAKKSGIDAVIIHDLSLIPIIKRYRIPFHISTQASVSNSMAANLFKKLGASRVILARECTLKDLKKIFKKAKIPVEVFIHGSMCVSISGRCLLSKTMYDKSANRGSCSQPCRQKWIVKNQDAELVYDGLRFLNAKDLCTVSFIDQLLKLGVAGFKIEGRMKDANYVSTVTSVYREAINCFEKKKVKEWIKRLRSVFNRGFSTGFYFGKPHAISAVDGSSATEKRVLAGKVLNYYPKQKAAELLLNNSGLKVNDEVIIEGRTTFLKQKVSSMQFNNKPIINAKKNERAAIIVNEKVRKNDLVYKLKKTSCF